ncbi:MAG TPA: acetoacetate--CoA ligase [Minicystis sp.]|nr:acetoacetate--CoA ligase [Minicystis sp.]
MSDVLWRPSAARAAAANITRFAREIEREHAVRLGDYAALHRFSVEAPERFWPSLVRFLGVRFEGSLDPPVDRGRTIADARWFPRVRLSFAENLLARHGDALAIVERSSAGARRTLTFAELERRAASVAAELDDAGVREGDRVAGILPNTSEAVIAMLAVNARGAIWSLCAPDLGLDAMTDRLGQIAPKVLFTSTSGGTRADPLRRVRAVVARLPTVERTVVVGAPTGSGVVGWDDVMARPYAPLAFRRLPFDAPGFVLYTSGTTGLPKAIVHGVGGHLVQLMKELVLHYDLKPDQRLFYHTSPGWNMWYWVVIALAVGATIVLWDGSPYLPRESALFDLADAERVDVFGVSPPYLATLRTSGVRVRDTHDLRSIHTILSTGSPLSPELFDFVYDAVKEDVCLTSLSGGTEINACFGTGDPAGPVRRGEMTVLGLGMDVDVWDDDGRPIRGAPGELVCKQPFPSQPVGLFGDPERRRLLATYYERFPGVWHHGDLAEITPSGGLVILGRSDATLKPGGHRIGTSEIYRQVEQIPEVVDSICVGQRWRGDVRVVLFVELRDGVTLDAPLEGRIRQQLARSASPYHVPARIVAVPAIPKTPNGKKAELAVRAVVHGEPVKNAAALANPEALAHYADLPALRS